MWNSASFYRHQSQRSDRLPSAYPNGIGQGDADRNPILILSNLRSQIERETPYGELANHPGFKTLWFAEMYLYQAYPCDSEN